MKRRLSLATSIIITFLVTYEILGFFQGQIMQRTVQLATIPEYEEECQKLTDVYSDLLSETMLKYLRQLNPLVSEEEILEEGTEAIVNWMKSEKHLVSEDFEYVAYVDKDGNFFSTKDTKTNVKDREYFEAIMKNGQDTFVSNIDISKVTGQSIIHICKAAKVKGKTVGFFTGIIPVSKIEYIIKSLTLGETGFAVLTDVDGCYVTTSGNMETVNAIFGETDQKVKDRLTKNLSMIAEGKEDQYWLKFPSVKQSYYTVFRAVPNTNWIIFFMVSQKQLYHPSYGILNVYIACAFVVSLIIITLIVILLKKKLKPLKSVGDNITEISSGNADLSKRLAFKSKTNNEITDVVDGFNTFTGKLQEIVVSLKNSKNTLNETGIKLADSTESTSSAITQIIACIQNLNGNITNQTASVEETSSAINQISANIQSLNKMVVAQSTNVGQASSAVEEMIGNINSVNRSVERMSQAFKTLETDASNGVQKQNDVNERIRAIEAESQTLQEANQVISAIAEQTNLLAMNAAIEAAHAGESGKGFSVVADEIRKLSETSSEQSKTIGNQLNVIVESINGIVKASQEAEVAFSSVSSGILSTDNVVSEIRNAMTEQAEGSKMITVALQNMNDSTAMVTDASTEMSEGARAILEEVKHLDESTTSMKNAMNEMTLGARKINDTGTMLHDLSGVVTESITKIGQQVDQFTV